MMKWSIRHKDREILNGYAPNNRDEDIQNKNW